jgi:AcrR family transcriptional regulator
MAGRELLHETSGWEFTVKQVSERAGVALQTLYRAFPTKDDLLLAVLEETHVVGAAAIAAVAADVSDPLEKVRAVILARITLLKSSKDVKRNGATVREHARLAQLFPVEVDRAYGPMVAVIADVLRQAVAAGVLHPVDPDRDARLVLHLSSYVYDRMALQADDFDADEAAEYLWQFCYASLERGRT